MYFLSSFLSFQGVFFLHFIRFRLDKLRWIAKWNRPCRCAPWLCTKGAAKFQQKPLEFSGILEMI